MSTEQLNNLRALAGLPVMEAAEPSTGVVDVTPSVQAIESPQKEVPADVRKALEHTVQSHAQIASDEHDRGSAQSHRFHNTVATFAMELDKMLDGSEEGFKRAGEHLHSALNVMVNHIPDVVVRYLSGNAVAELNKEEINKEGIRKHLRSYVEDRRS